MVKLWHHGHNGNFGDLIGRYILEKAGFEVTQSNQGKHLILTGSILQDANSDSIVIGAGFGEPTQRFKGRPKIIGVRGLRTALVLQNRNIRDNWLYGDPALTLPLLYKPDIAKKYTTGIIPHYIDKNVPQLKFQALDALLIDVCQPVETVINQILSCRQIYSSSLHGLIVATAYGIPNRWVKLSDNVVGNGFKFRDFFTSVGIRPYEPPTEIPNKIIPPLTLSESIVQPQLLLETIYENARTLAKL